MRFNSFAAADFDLASNLLTIDATKWLTIASAAAAYQPLNAANLSAIAALTTTAHGRGLLDDADAVASRVSLGLVIGTNVQAWSSNLDSYAGVTPSAFTLAILDESSALLWRTSLDAQQLDPDLTDVADGIITSVLGVLAAANTNTTALATTSFVQQEIDDADLLSDNCVLENDSTPIPDSCVGDGSDAGGGGGGNSVEVSLAITSDGSFFSTTVTGQAWVAAGSEIVCSPFGTTADGLTPEAVTVGQLDFTVSDKSAGVGFNLNVYSPNGLEGTIRAHCIGV